jgi:hypothetical protein
MESNGTGPMSERQGKQREQQRALYEPFEPKPDHIALSVFHNPHPSSFFFSRRSNPQPRLLTLPAELRLQIFSYLIDEKFDGQVEIYVSFRQHAYIYLEGKTGKLDGCNYRFCRWPVPKKRTKPSQVGLPFLCTCSQIYHESIALLYGKIRTLRVHWSGEYLPKDHEAPDLASYRWPKTGTISDGADMWLWMCKVITERMTGLKRLTIAVHTYKFVEILTKEVARIVQPLRLLRGLDTFFLAVYAPVNGLGSSHLLMNELIDDIKAEVLAKNTAIPSQASHAQI